MTNNNSLSFKGQNIYVGLDVHKKSWSVCTMTKDMELKRFNQNPDPNILAGFLNKNYPEADYYSVYEAGYCGFWIHDKLEQLGIQSIVVNPADIPTMDKERRTKTDAVDSRKLAKSLRSGLLTGIYTPSNDEAEHRSLLRLRKSLVKQQTKVKNQIKSYLSYFGKNFSERQSWSKKFIEELKQIKMKTKSGQFVLETHFDQLNYYEQKLKEVNKEIEKLLKERFKEESEILLSIPGIGIITAMSLLTELIDIRRFKSSDHLASYLGLVPGERSSGGKEVKTSLTRRGNPYLRSLIIESAWIAVKKDPALLQKYNQIQQRMISSKAIVNIARKLLNRIRSCLLKREQYQIALVQ